jgi:uncharacterized membrane protein
MYPHFTKCFLAGLITILPIGGLILLIVKLDGAFRPLVKDTFFDHFGASLLLTILAIYILGVTATNILGRQIWRFFDYILEQVPGVAVLYGTLKQILGYGTGKDALFRHVVFIKDLHTGGLELGLVTEEVKITLGSDSPTPRLCVFLPGSPNPTMGKMILIEADRIIPSQIPVDVALKSLLSIGKTGL